MNIEQLKEFVALEKRKRELDSELKQIAAPALPAPLGAALKISFVHSLRTRKA